MKKILLFIVVAMSLIVVSCDLSGLVKCGKWGSQYKVCPQKKVAPQKNPQKIDFGIESVRFYVNANANMNGIYTEKYIETSQKDNQFRGNFRYQVFRKNGEYKLAIVPHIKLYGGGDVTITPDRNATITSQLTSYTVTKGNRQKKYEILITTDDESVPLAFNVKYDGAPLKFLAWNVWGFTGLPWDVAGMRGGSRPVSINWHGDIDFPFTQLALPSKTTFIKYGQNYIFELKLDTIAIDYPIRATQDGRRMLINGEDLYILPTKNDSTSLDIKFVNGAVIDDSKTDNGEFDSHLFRSTAPNKISFAKNSALKIDYNQERQVGKFSVTIDGTTKDYLLILRKYAGDSITFTTENDQPIFPKEDYVQISFEKQSGYGDIGRYIPSGQRIITVETAQNFTITVNDDDSSQYYSDPEKRMWMKIASAYNNDYQMQSNYQHYEKSTAPAQYDRSYITKQGNTYTVDVSNLQQTTKVFKMTETYKDIFGSNNKGFNKDKGDSFANSGRSDCKYSDYNEHACNWGYSQLKKIPSRQSVQNKLGLSSYSRQSDSWVPLNSGSYTLTKQVKTIIYYKKPK